MTLPDKFQSNGTANTEDPELYPDKSDQPVIKVKQMINFLVKNLCCYHKVP